MKAFSYSAVDRGGERVTGKAWAEDELQLDANLEGQGLLMTEAHESRDVPEARPVRISSAELILFTAQLATVTGAGVPLLSGLEGIQARAPGRNLARLIGRMRTALEGGQTLSGVMEALPRAFPPVYRASVVAGEASGSLDRVLARLAAYMEWARGIRATTVQALIYPAILAGSLVGLVGILLLFLLPRIVGLFPGGVRDLPVQTRVLLSVSELVRIHALGYGFALVAVAAALVQGIRSARGRALFDRALLALPWIGGVARSIATSRFAATAAILQGAGCDVFAVLEVSGSACGNAALAAAYQRASQRVQRGEGLSQALEVEPEIDPLLVQMISVGERSGELDRCLERVAAHYDVEIPRQVKRMLALLEPLLLLGAGALVAFILLATVLPMFQAMETLR